MTYALATHCPHCFAESLPQVCPHCGFKKADALNEPGALPPFTTMLDSSVVLGRQIAEGGFGRVYRGYDVNLRRLLAIKEYCPAQLGGRGGDGITVVPKSDERRAKAFAFFLDRFVAEGQLLCRIEEGKRFIRAFNLIQKHGTAYLVMEWLEGPNLFNHLRSLPGGRMPVDQALSFGIKVLDSLEILHRRTPPIIHRDLHWGNIMLREGRLDDPVIMDFGLAREGARPEWVSSISVGVGAEGFASPEQLQRGAELTTAADIYAFGALLYACISGEKPYDSRNRSIQRVPRLDEIRIGAVDEIPKGIPTKLSDLVEHCLAMSPDDRPQGVAAIRRSLKDIWHSLDVDVVIDRPGQREQRFLLGPPPLLAATPHQTVVGRHYRPGIIFRDRLRGGGEGPEMVVIPAGRFLMGGTPEEHEECRRQGEKQEYLDSEMPHHEVQITTDFALGRYAVTRGEFAHFAEACRASISGELAVWNGKEWVLDRSKSWRDPGFAQSDSHPVVGIGWEFARLYIDWLNRESEGDGHYRLPSEAEWEYACRAGTSTPFHTGLTISIDQANYDGDFVFGSGSKGLCREKTVPVGTFRPNAFGLCEMHGNVAEWCADAFQENYARAPVDGSAVTGPESCPRVFRGGSWYSHPRDLRSARRFGGRQDGGNSGVGFRVARTLP